MDNTYAIKVVVTLDRIAEQLLELNKKLEPTHLTTSKMPDADLIKAAKQQQRNGFTLKVADELGVSDMER
jgi:hypothetical protein